MVMPRSIPRLTVPLFRTLRPLAGTLMGLVVTACASATPNGSGGPPALAADGSYALSAEEKALDCGRLTGRMQVRLMSLRGADYKVGPSGTASAMRTVTSTAFGTKTGSNADARVAADRPLLEAYNRRLSELGCASFDIDKELAARPSAPSPAPSIPAAKGR